MKRLTWTLVVAVLFGPLDSTPLLSQEVGIVSGRVVDAAQGSPLSGVLVTLSGANPTATDSEGFFAVYEVPAGPVRLALSHLGFGDHEEVVLVEAGDELSLLIRMSLAAIELAPFVIEGRSELEERRVSSGHGINEIRRPQIEAAVRSGIGLTELLQTRMPGTMASSTGRSTTCVQYRAIRSGGGSACREVTVVLDGIQIANPSYIYSQLPLNDIERIEMLSPGQAGLQYGTSSGQGVLLIETQRGELVRRADASRFVTGLAWEGEESAYPWSKVLGTTFVTNAIGVGAALLLAQECLWSPEVGSLGLRTRCNGFNTAAIGVLSVAFPAFTGGMVAGWGGETTRSRGRLSPTSLAAGMTLTAGYLLVIHGDDRARTAGLGLLAFGVPVTLALSDRVFRILR
ncbi:MAG: carboxypeptidase regulatory-like domain-containing protein [Gemmatimonadetes bacterium]|nr:carboxypeptidase regulatory-like domain-containing protein [Gemmatimonadota bacterium]MDA1103536.1 carboxypeptidase regulatory-like domain-containing protein [Gemmatimonadota bacterium]